MKFFICLLFAVPSALNAQWNQDCPLVPVNTFIYHDGDIIGNQLVWVEECSISDPYSPDDFGPIGGGGTDICVRCPVEDDPPKPTLKNIEITQRGPGGGSVSGPTQKGRWGNAVTLEAEATGNTGIEMRVYLSGQGIPGAMEESSWSAGTSSRVYVAGTIPLQLSGNFYSDEMTRYVAARYNHWPTNTTVEDSNTVTMYRQGQRFQRTTDWSPPMLETEVPVFYGVDCQGGSPTLTYAVKSSFSVGISANLAALALQIGVTLEDTYGASYTPPTPGTQGGKGYNYTIFKRGYKSTCTLKQYEMTWDGEETEGFLFQGAIATFQYNHGNATACTPDP